jgi:acetyl esterase/lipase
MGSAKDDARFARFVLEKSKAIFISVDYRLAPEYPFPVAVEDGTDALLYVIKNATELRIDPNRLATSGFSAGGNIAITAPMRLHLLGETMPIPEHKIVAIATFYPITDYTLSREERRAGSVRPEATLPPSLTNLFDASYLFPPDLDLEDPCLSPNRASDELLIKSIPDNVFLFTCEWDMLLREGEYLAQRLEQPPISKRVFYNMIRGVQHGWDKGPSPMKPPPKSEKIYRMCCTRLCKVFYGENSQTIFERARRVLPPPPLPPRERTS